MDLKIKTPDTIYMSDEKQELRRICAKFSAVFSWQVH